MRHIAQAVVTVIVVCLVLPLAALQFSAVQELVLRRALREVNARIPGVVFVGSVDGNMLSEINLREVRVDYRNRLVASADAVAVRWNPLALLLRNEIDVRRVSLSGAFVHLWKADERWSIVAAFAAPATAPAPAEVSRRSRRGGRPVELAVAEVAGEDLGLLISGASEDRRYQVAHVAGGVAVRDGGVEIDLGALTGVSSAPPARIRGAQGRVKIPFGAPYAWRVEGFALDLRASRVRLDGAASLMPGGAVDLSVTASPAAPQDAGPLGSPVRIPVWVSAAVAGPWEKLRWQAEVTSPAGRASFSGAAGLPVTAPSSPDWRAAWIEAAGEVDDFSPAAWFGQSQVAGSRLRATLQAGARRDAAGALVAHASVDGAGSTLAGRRVSTLSAAGEYKQRRLEVSVRLAGLEGEAAGTGRVDFARQTYDVRLTTKHFQPQAFLGAALAGDVNLTATLTGSGLTPETVRAHGRLDLEKSRLAGYDIARIRLPVVLAERRAKILAGQVRSKVLDVRLAGQVPLTAGVPADLRILARAEDLGALLPTTDPTKVMTGRAMAHLVVQGELDELQIRGAVHGADLAGRGAALPKLSATFEAAHVNPFAQTGSVELLAEATTPVYVPYDAESATVAISLARDAEGETQGTFYAAIVEEGRPNEVRGRYSLPASGFRLQLESVSLVLADHRWTNHGEAVVDVRGEGIVIDKLDLRAGDQQIFADGRIDPAGTQNLRVLVNRLDLRMLKALSGRSERVAGELNASAWVTGTFAAPEFTAAVAVTDLALREYAVQMASGFFTYAARRLDAEVRVVQRGVGGQLRADFHLPLDLSASPPPGTGRLYEGPLEGEMVAERVSLAIAAAATPEVADAAGRVDAHVTLRGTPARPRLAGDLAVENGRFRIVPSGVRYERMTVAARFRGERIFVDRVRVVSAGGGNLSAQGELALPLTGGEGFVDLRAIADNLKVIDNRLAEGRVDADLTLTGSLAAPVLRGRVETERVVVTPPKGDERKRLELLTFSHPGIHFIGEEPAAAEQAARAHQVRTRLLERAAIDVALVVNRNAWVRNDDMNIELRGNLRAQKACGEETVRVSGEITTVRGFYRLRTRRLEIEEGRLMFTGTEALNPLIDVTLRYDAPEYQISAHVTGTTEKPNLTLSSTPPLEQGDIVAVLVFGRPFDRLGAGEQAEMRDRVGQLLGGFAAEQLRKRFGSKLGVDTLEVTPGGTEEGAELGVGKYVNEQIFVEYVQRFGLEAASEVRLEYYFTRRWLIQTSTSTSGQSGVDIFWNVSF